MNNAILNDINPHHAGPNGAGPDARTTVRRRFLALGAVVALGLSACGSDDDASTDDTVATTEQPAAQDSEQPSEEATDAGLTMSDAWSRQPADGQTASAVYGLLTNDTDETVTAVSATTSVTDQVELHEVLMDDEGQMSMREKEGGYEIAPGETFVFEPGGAHIMLLDIDPATYPDTVDVTLTFDDGSSIDFTAEVRSIDSDMDMDMGDDGMDMDTGGEGMEMDG